MAFGETGGGEAASVGAVATDAALCALPTVHGEPKGAPLPRLLGWLDVFEAFDAM